MVNLVNLMAIISAKDPSKEIYYASVKNQYDMKIAEGDEQLEIGALLIINVPTIFAQSNKVAVQYELKKSDYTVIPQLFDTKVNEGGVTLSFQFHSNGGSRIEHEILGVINKSNTVLPMGPSTISVESFTVPFQLLHETQWLLTGSAPCEFSAFGIVCGNPTTGSGQYVWCKERSVGRDVLLDVQDYLPIGTWVQMTWKCREDVEATSPIRYLEIDPIYETTVSARTIGMRLEVEVEGSTSARDLHHPFVGLILNRGNHATCTNGRYLATIVRLKKKLAKDGSTESVWNLCFATPIRQPAPLPTPSPRATTPAPFNNEPPPSYEATMRIPIAQRAVINGIMSANNLETKFFLWNFDEKKSGILIVATDQSDSLGIGTFFTATDFKENHQLRDTLISNGKNLRIIEDLYEKRFERNTLLMKVSAGKSRMKDGFLTMEHEHFGDIVDNMDMLNDAASRLDLELKMWIKRSKLGARHCWVVVEAL